MLGAALVLLLLLGGTVANLGPWKDVCRSALSAVWKLGGQSRQRNGCLWCSAKVGYVPYGVQYGGTLPDQAKRDFVLQKVKYPKFNRVTDPYHFSPFNIHDSLIHSYTKRATPHPTTG